MAELAPRAAWEGAALPLTLGGVALAALPEAPLFSVAPFRGQAQAAASVLGAPPPDPGHAADLPSGGRLIWAGLDLWLLWGPEADADLAARLAPHAAVTDQTDGWTALGVTGPAAADALARLVPLDLHPSAFLPGSAARTQLRHMACLLLAREEGFEILVTRSFTRSALHDVEGAMRALAARAELRRLS